MAEMRNFSPRGYFFSRIFKSSIPVVTLHRPPPEIITFFPRDSFFSIKKTSASGFSSLMVVAHIIPAAPPPIIATRILFCALRHRVGFFAEDVEIQDIEDTRGVKDKKSHEPALVSHSSGFPESHPLPND